jgi:hypothetical protein
VGFVVNFSFLVAAAALPFSFDGFFGFVAVFQLAWLKWILYSLQGDLPHSYSI